MFIEKGIYWCVLQAVFLIEEGAMPEDVDEVIENFGMPIGPLKVADLSGKLAL